MSSPTNTPAKKRRPWKPDFLKALSRNPNVTAAAKAAGKDRKHVYHIRSQDPEFARAWDDAIEQSTDRLVGAMHDRAVDGVEKPVYQGGQLVGTVTEYSDTLAIFLAKAHRPEIYREKVQLDINQLDNAITHELERVAGRGQAALPGPAEDIADTGDGISEAGTLESGSAE